MYPICLAQAYCWEHLYRLLPNVASGFRAEPKKICDHLSLTIEGRIGKIDACLSLAISVITNTYRGTILSSSVPRAETSTLSMLTSSTMPARCSGAIVMSVLVPCWPPKCPTSATPASLPVDHPRA